MPFNYYSYLVTSWTALFQSAHIRSFLFRRCLAAPPLPVSSKRSSSTSSVIGGSSPPLSGVTESIGTLGNREGSSPSSSADM